MVRYFLLIEGRVQKGGFRSFIKKHALLLGVTGYAENLPTGEVVAVLEGEEESINKLIDFIEREAPAYIEVERITKRRDKYRGTFSDFERKGEDVLAGLEDRGVKEILLRIASYSQSTDEKLERGIGILNDMKRELGSIKADTSAMLAKQDETIEAIKSVKADTSAMLSKQDETIEAIKSVKADTSAMLAKQDETIGAIKSVKADTSAMLAKQDETIEVIKSVKADTSAMLAKQDETIETIREEGEKNRRVIKDHLAQDIARIYEEIDGIKATLAKIMEKVGS
jgi:acylphosphatase